MDEEGCNFIERIPQSLSLVSIGNVQQIFIFKVTVQASYQAVTTPLTQSGS